MNANVLRRASFGTGRNDQTSRRAARLRVEILEDRDVPTGGLDIPSGHPRLWFDSSRLAQAKQWYAAHPFTPAADDPFGNAFAYQLTGNTTYASQAITQLMDFTISQTELDGVQSDNYRWNDWVPVVFDWCYDQMTASQISTFTDRYNGYTDTIRQKSWGGAGMEANNYYWGLWRNELNWGIATYGANSMADTFINDALVTRWQNGFLPYAAGPGAGGVPQEGTQYGRYMLEYPTVPLVTAGLEGRDLFAETNFYTEAAYYLIYSTSPGPVTSVHSNGSYYQLFPFDDAEVDSGFPDAADTYYANLMTALAQANPNTPLAGYIHQWLSTVGAQPDDFVAAVDTGGPGQAFTSLPTDYYAPGPAYLYARSNWTPSAMSLNFQLGAPTGVGHAHHDYGTFQILRNGQWLTKESTGYSGTLTGYKGVGTTSTASTLAHNGLVIGGLGLANAYADGDPVITRLESRPDYTFASDDLSAAYRAHASSNPSRDDNPNVKSAVRDFVYVRALDALVVLDRIESTSELVPAASVDKTFVLHFPTSPTVQGNTVVGVNGNQALQLTTLTPAGQTAPTFQVVNEVTGTPDSTTDYQYRLEETTKGQAQSYLVNVLYGRDATAANLSATLTEDATTFTVTLRDPNGKTAVIKFAKGMASTGGEFGYAASGTPTTSPLTTTVEPIRATTSGITWGAGASLQVSAPSTATAGTTFSVTVKAVDANGNVNTGYTGTAHLTSSDGQAVLPANYTFTAADAGVHTFTVTLKTAGIQSVQVADTVDGTLVGSAGVTVNAAAASALTLGNYSSPTTVGTSNSFVVKLVDAYGNRATGYLGTVHFSSTDALASLPADYTFTSTDAGARLFNAAFNGAGTWSLTATDTVVSALTGTQSGIVVNSSGDTTPPTITNKSPAGGATGVATTAVVTATFSEPVQPTTISFVLRDAANKAVTGSVSYDSPTQTATFQPTAALLPNTTYTATLSGAKDPSGNTMSPVSWSFTTVTSQPTPHPTVSIDFNTSSSPTAAGYTGFRPTAYSAAAGFGWQSLTGMGTLDRATTNSLTRDFAMGTDGTFLVDVPDGTYDLVIGLGDASAVRDLVSVWADGQLLATNVTNKAGQFLEARGRVTVADGQINIHLVDGGGKSPKFALDKLLVTPDDPTAYHVWPDAAKPAGTGSVGTSGGELGLRFQTDVAGYVTGVRFYKGTGNTGIHTGSLWAADGTRLATATFTNESASGWQEVHFSAPVAVQPNTTYVVSYFSPTGKDSVDLDYFAVAGLTSGHLTVLPGQQGGGGVYNRGSGFPANTNRSSNYWVDVVFTQDTTPPTVTGVTPANNATGVPTTAAVKVTFSEAMNASSINASTVLLKDAGGSTVSASVSYDPNALTATLLPAAALATNSTYTVVVKGGSANTSVQDQSGNPLSADFASAFTTASGSGLVAAFAFNEGTGTTVSSTVGGLTGTISGATWTSGGRYGKALSFNGTNSVVTIADSSALDLTTGMTLEAWVDPATVSGWESVILKERPSAQGLSYGLYASTNVNAPGGYINTGGSDVAATGTSALTPGTWAHLALTYDGSNLRLYVNGTLVRTTANAGSLIASTGNLSIGGNSIWGEYFNGLIDEVRVYNRALSQSEIQSDMNTGI